ncbi:hypothetical protein M4D70_25295 [Brevibacillus borstelensis]|uniref:hypothetical protein n=1 Tax=Brevibacillus borstelensis TaxID=45462 RepID=UPI00203D9AFD|nr:hypothetical protein [Brevibacillus borstelensis]MCM3625496.1 hypothetical protein [Brevibacillus borstelensis]
MNPFDQILNEGGFITAAVYMSIGEKLPSESAEREVAKQLQEIFKFINLKTEIIIVESYVDWDGSMRERNRLVEDIKVERYKIVLTCGELSEWKAVDIPIIDVLKQISSN